jgi:hypothetical protein
VIALRTISPLATEIEVPNRISDKVGAPSSSSSCLWKIGTTTDKSGSRMDLFPVHFEKALPSQDVPRFALASVVMVTAS